MVSIFLLSYTELKKRKKQTLRLLLQFLSVGISMKKAFKKNFIKLTAALLALSVSMCLTACEKEEKSAYQIWLEAGYTGDEEDFLEWIKNASALNENPHIKSIGHGGYWEAPENTLSAYKMAKQRGFEYVECDVTWTKDGVPVLLHDDAINRTARNADGSKLEEEICITDITYEEALEYDFGCWKAAKYKGEPIPTFEEFIQLCKQTGLMPYVEIKPEATDEQLDGLLYTVERYGITENTTWIDANLKVLKSISKKEPKARLGVLSNVWANRFIEDIKMLRTPENEVFMNLMYSAVTEEVVGKLIEQDIPLEVWTVDDAESMINVDGYVSGFTSNRLTADVVFCEEGLKPGKAKPIK